MFAYWKKCGVLVLLLFIFPIICGPVPDNGSDANLPGRAALDNFPLIDGHNDIAWVLLLEKQNQLKNVNFYNLADTLECSQCIHTDINKLKTGKVGAVFWVAYTHCESQFKDSVEHTLEQIDVIKRFINKYPEAFQFVTTADGVLEAYKNKKIGSLLAVEGGQSIAGRLSILRMYYELGVRYLTLTHVCNTPWADASPVDTNAVNNVTDFGKKVIWEMNRLGMMVDLSHVAYGTMVNAIKTSKAPVIFSHSNSYTVYPHHRNVRDDVIQLLKTNKGIIMVNFFTGFLGKSNVTIETVVDHINYLAKKCGVDCVGIGSDFSGVTEVSVGLENVSKYPELFDLLRKSDPSTWTIENLEKLAGRNLIRVFKEVEKVRDLLKNEELLEDWIPKEDLDTLPEVSKSCKSIPHY